MASDEFIWKARDIYHSICICFDRELLSAMIDNRLRLSDPAHNVNGAFYALLFHSTRYDLQTPNCTISLSLVG